MRRLTHNTIIALALGGIVQQVIEEWFQQNYIPESQQAKYTETRPNYIRVWEVTSRVYLPLILKG